MLAYLSFVSLYFIFTLLWFSIIERPLFTFYNIRSNTSGRLTPAVLVAGSDTLLYRFWQSKIDASALTYLKAIRSAIEGDDPDRTEIGRLTLQRLCDDLTRR